MYIVNIKHIYITLQVLEPHKVCPLPKWALKGDVPRVYSTSSIPRPSVYENADESTAEGFVIP